MAVLACLWDCHLIAHPLFPPLLLPQAEQLIKRRLEVTPDEPRLWCALGDLTLDDAAYLQASAAGLMGGGWGMTVAGWKGTNVVEEGGRMRA